MLSFFTGAGASKPFGYSTTDTFSLRVQDHLSKVLSGHVQGDKPPHRYYPRYFFDARNFLEELHRSADIEVILRELNDLKRALEKLRTQRTREMKWKDVFLKGLMETVDSDLSDLDFLLRDIHKLVYDEYWQAESDKNATKIYDDLFSSLAKSQEIMNIFTTNYDLTIERAFMDKEPDAFTDGFAYDAARRNVYWDISHYDKQARLYKLHGSVNWKRTANGEIYRVPTHDFTKHEDHVILYPGFKGVAEDEPFAFMHERLRETLMRSRAGLFIGFAFRDEYINEIIVAALKSKPQLELIVWNPCPPDVRFHRDRVILFKELFGERSTIGKLTEVLHKRKIL